MIDAHRESPIASAAAELARRLFETDTKIVFAESCTAGLVAASLAAVPGISRQLCGSAVVYREETKTAWLNVSPDLLANYSAVSPEVTETMAHSVCERTPQAHLAVAVTGHLGPDAPVELDGVVYLAAVRRLGSDSALLETRKIHLQASARVGRQHEATVAVLRFASEFVD